MRVARRCISAVGLPSGAGTFGGKGSESSECWFSFITSSRLGPLGVDGDLEDAMTEDKDFKRLVRAQASRSGETYAVARRRVLAAGPTGRGSGPWPSWIGEHVWLAGFVRDVERAAATRGGDVIETADFLAALPDLVDGHALAKEMFAAAGITSRRRDGLSAAGDERPRLGADAAAILDAARDEASRGGGTVGPAEMLAGVMREGRGLDAPVGAVPFGLHGIPTGPAPVAAGVDRGNIPRPTGQAPLVLGGALSASVRSHAAELASKTSGKRQQDLTVVGVFAAAGPPDGAERAARAFERAWGPTGSGLHVVDAGLVTRDDAYLDEVCARLVDADIVFLNGGRAERILDVMLATPAYDALVTASDGGTIVMGNSAGAIALGSCHLTNWETGDEAVPLPMFGWLADTVVYPHYQERYSHRRARAYLAAVPASIGLCISDPGAVVIEPGWKACYSVAARTDDPPLFFKRGRPTAVAGLESGTTTKMPPP